MLKATQSQRSQLLPLAALAYAAALGIATVAVVTRGTWERAAWLIVAPPLTVAVLAVGSARRELLWSAIGACLALGMLTIFSIGIFVLQIALCLLVWWMTTRRRSNQPVVTWTDLLWESAGFLAFLTPFLGIV